jgi:hypothetical protein
VSTLVKDAIKAFAKKNLSALGRVPRLGRKSS